jgi:hypothetical protein
MDTAQIKSDHLYLRYSYYDTGIMGYREDEKIVPLDRIGRIVEHVGPRGGDHGWKVVGRDGKELADFGRKHTDLRDATKALLATKNIPAEMVHNTGSGPCY